MLKQPDKVRQIQQIEDLIDLTRSICDKLDDLHTVASDGLVDFPNTPVSMEDCEAAALLYKKIERKTVSLLKGIVLNHEAATYFLEDGSNEGNKDYPP